MVLLAHLERCVTQPNDEGGEDYCEEQLTLRNIVDTNGFMLQIGLNIPSSFLVQESLYEDRDPDEQAGGEHLGNQHADLEFTYKDTVCQVISSLDAFADALIGNGHCPEG